MQTSSAEEKPCLAHLKFAAQHLERPINYWEKNRVRLELNSLDVIAHHPQNTTPAVLFGGGNIME